MFIVVSSAYVFGVRPVPAGYALHYQDHGKKVDAGLNCSIKTYVEGGRRFKLAAAAVRRRLMGYGKRQKSQKNQRQKELFVG